jgi:hypothetical protein
MPGWTVDVCRQRFTTLFELLDGGAVVNCVERIAGDMKFDLYDYVGVIVPGTIVVLTLALLYPALAPTVQNSISLGDLGIMLILAFLVGHLLQAIGNVWEWIIWKPSGGMPTSWPSKSASTLLTAAQKGRLETKLQSDFGTGLDALSDGRGPIREIFVRIRQNGKPDRIEKFNRNYGLMRGAAAGFLVSTLLVLINNPAEYQAIALLLGGVGLATYRMVRFGTHYAREVFAEYLNLSSPKEAEAEAKS